MMYFWVVVVVQDRHGNYDSARGIVDHPFPFVAHAGRNVANQVPYHPTVLA
jgi:hypothetical protein